MAPAMYFPRSTDVIVEMAASSSEPNSRRKTSHDGGSEPCDFEPIPRTCAAAVDVATSVQPRRSQCSLQLPAQPEFLCACLPRDARCRLDGKARFLVSSRSRRLLRRRSVLRLATFRRVRGRGQFRRPSSRRHRRGSPYSRRENRNIRNPRRKRQHAVCA